MSTSESMLIRYKTALAQSGVKGVEIAKRLGISKAFLGQVITRGRPAARLSEIAAALSVPVEWLTHGTGPAPTWAQPAPAADPAALESARRDIQRMQTTLDAYQDIIDIGSRTMFAMALADLSPAAVCERANIPLTTFGALLTRPGKIPAASLEAIAKALGLTPGTLLRNEPPLPGWTNDPEQHGRFV